MPHVLDFQWGTIALGLVTILITLAGMGFFLRRASYAPAMTVMEKTLLAYKEAALAEEKATKTREAHIAALNRQINEKDSQLTKERERGDKLEKLMADWMIERQQLLQRISTLEDQVRKLTPATP